MKYINRDLTVIGKVAPAFLVTLASLVGAASAYGAVADVSTLLTNPSFEARTSPLLRAIKSDVRQVGHVSAARRLGGHPTWLRAPSIRRGPRTV